MKGPGKPEPAAAAPKTPIFWEPGAHPRMPKEAPGASEHPACKIHPSPRAGRNAATRRPIPSVTEGKLRLQGGRAGSQLADPPPPHLGVSLQNGSKRAQWCLAPLLPQLRLLSSYAPGDGGERNKLGLALGARPAGKIGIS